MKVEEEKEQREREREINKGDLKVYLGDSNRQAQPSRENLEWHPQTNTSKSKAWSEMTSGERKRGREKGR